MSGAQSMGVPIHPSGVWRAATVCRVWHRARSSVVMRGGRRHGLPHLCRRRAPIGACPGRRPGGNPACRRVLEASHPFHGEGYRKAWAKLRVRPGMRTSKERLRCAG